MKRNTNWQALLYHPEDNLKDEKTSLEQTNGIVLSSETAFRFFGKSCPDKQNKKKGR